MTIGNVKKRGEVRVSKGSVVFGWRAPRPPRVVFVLGFVSLINLSLEAKIQSFLHSFHPRLHVVADTSISVTA